MIKKIILITVVILLASGVPAAMADVVYPVQITDNDFLNIEYNVQTTKVKIGEKFTGEITITNLSSKSFIIYDISFHSLGINVGDVYADMYWYRGLDISLSAYEEITLRVDGIVDEDLMNVYKEDGGFFVNASPTVRYAEDKNLSGLSFGEFYLYMERCDGVPIQITNLNDADQYIEFEWLDDRDIFYYCNNFIMDSDSDASESFFYTGELAYEYKIKNISNVQIFDLQPGEENIVNNTFYSSSTTEDITDTLSYSFCKTFKVGDQYYCVTVPREYKVDFLEPPLINLDINLISVDMDEHTKEYEIIFTNVSSEVIENFGIELHGSLMAQEKNSYIEYGDFEAGDVWVMQHKFDNFYDFNRVYAGYYINGMSYLWAIDIDFMTLESVSLSPVTEYRDYVYPAQEPANSHTPQVVQIVEPAPSNAEIQEPETTTNVTVIERRKPFIWTAIIVICLVLSAAAMITITIVKKGKRESND